MPIRLPNLKSLWMVVAGFLFAVMGVLVKIGAGYFSSAELVFYRSFVGLLVIGAIVSHQRLPLTTPHWRTHILRSVSGFVALMLFFYSITMLPLATAVTLNYTSPLFLVLLAVPLLKERVTLLLVLAVVIGFFGVALVLRPTLHVQHFAAGLLGLASGLLSGIAYLNVRQLGRLGEPEWRVVFYFTLASCVGAGAWMMLGAFHALDLVHGLLLLGLGGTATMAQLAMTRAYREGETLAVGSLAYTTVVFASLLGLVVWREILSPASWLAIGLIILSGVTAVQVAPRAPAAAD